MNKHKVLKQYFGYDEFRQGQNEVIDKILAKQDVLGIMPTGAGKSLCYQIPALLFSGITIVISPLISLMKDQVYLLNQAGIHAAYINSSLTEQQIQKAFENAGNGTYKIIYIAPERLDTPQFLKLIQKIEISLIAVDEAHCVSQWGQDFRPGYLNIAPFVNTITPRPVLCAFTATATEEVKEDIVTILELQSPHITITGFDRKNLYFAVKTVKDKKTETLSYVQEHANQCGIIYCATRNNVEEVFELLCANDIPVAKYHGGMGTQERTNEQEAFIYDRKTVMVATNAFGMGIDKSNVRYVLHYNMPLSIENYYQEAGRAGRDGDMAECMLFYAPKDIVTNKLLIENKESKKELDMQEVELIKQRDLQRLRIMTNYCTTKKCLRHYILEYFGESAEDICENCSNCLTEYETTDVTEISKKIINCVYELRQRFGINVVLGVLRGSRSARILDNGFDQLQSYNTLNQYAESSLREIINILVQEQMLVRTDEEYPVLRLGTEYKRLKDETNRVYIKSEVKQSKEAKSRTKKQERSAGKKNRKSEQDMTQRTLTEQETMLFEQLRTLRREIAAEEQVPPYIVFSDKTLRDMIVKLPLTLEEMDDVNGVGQMKKEKYGMRFLEVIKAYTESEDCE